MYPRPLVAKGVTDDDVAAIVKVEPDGVSVIFEPAAKIGEPEYAARLSITPVMVSHAPDVMVNCHNGIESSGKPVTAEAIVGGAVPPAVNVQVRPL